jgi:alkylation response protein AidB-like acyl-CoA dehydrogenase
MRFALTSDQTALREAVGEMLTRECSPTVVRAAWPRAEGGTGKRAPREGCWGGRTHADGVAADRASVAAVWAKLAEMGVLGTAVPEQAGGLGLGAGDLVPLLEETGRVALPLPIVETAFVAAPLLAAVADSSGPAESAGPADELLDRLVSGEARATTDLGSPGLVPWSESCEVLLLTDAERVAGTTSSMWVVERAACHLQPVESIDGARSIARVGPEARATGALLTDDAELVAAAFDRGALGAAAQLVGLGRRLLSMTVQYAGERRQFGVAIGSFQALKHHLADALLALEFAAPAVLRAAQTVDAGAPERTRDVSMAKALASDAAERAAAVALQCHGAIAYTVEYDLHLWAKRVWTTSRAWGDADWHRARVGAALSL